MAPISAALKVCWTRVSLDAVTDMAGLRLSEPQITGVDRESPHHRRRRTYPELRRHNYACPGAELPAIGPAIGRCTALSRPGSAVGHSRPGRAGSGPCYALISPRAGLPAHRRPRRDRGARAPRRGCTGLRSKAGSDGRLARAFREPIATLLLDVKTVGQRYTGPHWEHIDGSAVVGEAVGNAPGATDMPPLSG